MSVRKLIKVTYTAVVVAGPKKGETSEYAMTFGNHTLASNWVLLMKEWARQGKIDWEFVDYTVTELEEGEL